MDDHDDGSGEAGKGDESIDRSTSVEPEQNDLLEEEEDHIQISDGPFRMKPLIQLVPKELEYTCFDAFENNLYLGTKTGDLLHYFEMEPNNYMLVSQTMFESELHAPIDKMIVLPEIERCLVQSSGSLQFFLLPEFAPVPNVDRLEGINDFSVIKYSEKSKRYHIHTYGDHGITRLSVYAKNISTIKTYDFKPIKKALNHNKVLMAAKDSNYEIIDLKSGTEIPLFRISETSTDLDPVISSFSSLEFLVTCGSSKEEASMALVVNHEGDITQGTIVLDKYPENIIVELPFVIVDYGDKGVHIHKMEINSEPTIVQKIGSKNMSKIRITQTANIFNSSNSDDKLAVVEKLRLVPLLPGNHEFRLNQESTYVNQVFEQLTSLAIYGSIGIFLLNKCPVILGFHDYGESSIESIEDALAKKHPGNSLSPYEKIETAYLKTMYLLLITFHSASINKDIVKKWCNFSSDVDIRLFLYLCDFQIYGDVWIPNGLLKFVQECRKLKLKNMFQHYIEIVRFMRHQLKTKLKNEMKDSENVLKSFDMVLFRNCMNDESSLNIEDYGGYSLPEIMRELEKNPSQYYSVMLEIFQKLGDFKSCVKLLLEQKRILELSEFLLKNVSTLSHNDAYTKEDLKEDVMLLLDNDSNSKDETLIIENALAIIREGDIPVKELISKVKESSTKVMILEKLGADDSNDREFLIDYYVAQLQRSIELGNLWDLFAQFTTSYSRDLDYMKPTIENYMSIKLKNDPHCAEFVLISDKIKSLAQQDNAENQMKEVFEKITRFDVSNILCLLFLNEDERIRFFDGKLLDTLMLLNDFEAIEKLVDKDNLLIVITHYLELTAHSNSPILIQSLLIKKIQLLSDSKKLIEVLEIIPIHYKFATLFGAIFPVVRKIDGEKREQDIRKALLRQQISINKQITKDISAE